MVSNQSTKSVRFVTENIMFRKVRQDDFEKFMTVKHKKSYYLAQIEVYLTFLLRRCLFYAAASACGIIEFSASVSTCGVVILFNQLGDSPLHRAKYSAVRFPPRTEQSWQDSAWYGDSWRYISIYFSVYRIPHKQKESGRSFLFTN